MVNENAETLFGTDGYNFTPADNGGRSVGFIGGTNSNGITVFSYGYNEGINYEAEKLGVNYDYYAKYDAGFADSATGSTVAGTYYNANEARAAFYPSISISGTYGWTNQAGNTIINPGKMNTSAIGSLTQPLLYRGANIARLKIAKAQQAEAMLGFEQAILNAGADVSDALSLYQSAEDKRIQRVKQINSLEKSVEYTQELLTLGTSNTNYLEVLTAQQSLLNAQLSGISDEFQRLQAVVNLYHALGGGTK